MQKQEMEAKMARLQELEAKEADYENMRAQKQSASAILKDLFDDGLIEQDAQGKVSPIWTFKSTLKSTRRSWHQLPCPVSVFV